MSKQTRIPTPATPSQQSQQTQANKEMQDALLEVLKQQGEDTKADIIAAMALNLQDFKKDIQGELASNFKDFKNEVQDELDQVKEYIDERNNVLRDDIVFAMQVLAGHVEKIDMWVNKAEERIEELEENVEKNKEQSVTKTEQLEGELAMIQFREMEYAVRFRGLKEMDGERLRELVVEALAQLTELKPEQLEEEIDRVYRVNSWIARQRKLPRDVVVYFTKKQVRNMVIQQSYVQKLVIAEQEVMVLKEVPPKILRKRRDYAFLAEALKKEEIPFKWEVPEGITCTYRNQRHRLNSVWKAKDFMVQVLKRTPPSSPPRMRRERQEIPQVLPEKEVLQLEMAKQEVALVEGDPKEQRMTRAAARRREEEERRMREEPARSDIVGGARRKVLGEMGAWRSRVARKDKNAN